MFYVDLNSLLLGFIGGMAATFTVGGFTALVVTELTRHADRRRLSQPRRAEYPSVSELLREHRATLPAVAPQKDSAPATTDAGAHRSVTPPRPTVVKTSQQRPRNAGTRVTNGSQAKD